MLLTALALSDDNLLATLRESQVLQRIELSLHSCKVLVAHNITWRPACHALHDLQQVATALLPLGPLLVEPYTNERVLRIWNDMGTDTLILRCKLR
jgi:hypothetical protein